MTKHLFSHQALAQVQTGNIKLGAVSSRAGNLLWRSVYLVKQVISVISRGC